MRRSTCYAPLGARQDGGGPGRAGLGRTRPRQIAHYRRVGRASSHRTASLPALLLLALSPGQRALSVYRPDRTGRRVGASRSARFQAGEARGAAGPRLDLGRGCRIPRRSAVIISITAPPAAEPQSAAQEGTDIGGADPPAGELGAPAAGGRNFRGRALDRLDLAVERVRGLPVLLIITFRPEFQPPWISEPHVTMLVLNRLDRHDRAALATQIAGGKALPDEIISQIVERTDGVPLFAEELTKSVLESGLLREEEDRYVLDGPLPPLAIPTSLHASLMARLDRLASVRQVAQIGAAFGRWFRYASLRAVSGIPEDELQASLTRLVDAELVFQSGTPPDAVYTFKHALVQEAAYGTLLRNARQQLHGRIAEALKSHFPEMTDSQPELFARHYTEARLVEKSVFYWSKAARRSAARSAMAEAAVQFQRALDQLALLPDSPERQRQELEFCSSLGTVLQSVKGYAAPETGQTLARARELWERLGSPSEFLQVSYAQSLYHEIRGELHLAHRLDKDLLRLSRQRDDAAGLVLAHQSLGRNLMFAGRFASSRSHLEQTLALCDVGSDASLVRQAGVHPRVASQAFMAISLFCLGHPAQAVARSTAAIIEAQQLAHSPSLAMSLTNGARLGSLVGNDAM